MARTKTGVISFIDFMYSNTLNSLTGFHARTHANTDFKATFSIKIKHWKNMTALSNMPITNSEQ